MRLALIIILTIYVTNIWSQKTYFLESKIYYGDVIPHRVGMQSLAQNPCLGAEVNLIYNSKNNNYFDSVYNSPYSGFGFSYFNLGNKNVLGYSAAVYSFMELKLFNIKNIEFNTRINGGLAYLSEKYDKFGNTENIAIGSNINFYFNLNFVLNYKLKKTPLSFRFGGGLTHYSNGSVRKPNLGINHLGLLFSAAYQLNDNTTGKISETRANTYFDKHYFSLMATLAPSDEYINDYDSRGGGFLCSTIALGYSFAYTKLGRVGVSLGTFYNENLNYYTYDGVLYNKNESTIDIIRMGVSLGHELFYKKISLVSYVGVYYYNKIKPDEKFYLRLGVRYYPFENIFINASIKAYGFKARYIESGIGFVISR